jgi:predicted transcriptional regulator
MFGIRPDDIYRAGKRPLLVSARSVFCYWAVRELGLTTTAVARVLGLTQPAVSIAVRRGERIVTSRGIQLDDA